MAPRKKCSICGSRQWRKSTVGLVTCSEGHVLQHYINESEETENVGTHMMRKRTIKSDRRKKDRASRADPALYHGDRARFHYYQCLQLFFRAQVSALKVLWNLPSEFETICRDLWTLHLNLLQDPPSAEPFYYTREQEGYQSEYEGEEKGHQTRSANKGDSHSRERTPLALDETSPSSDDELLPPEISVLLEEYPEVSSSDDGSSGDEPRARNDTCTSRNKSFVSRADRPENTIALLVLACWSIRLPVVYMDFINAIESFSLPYLDHVRSLPSSLRRHLTKHAVQALSPHYAPKTLSLHRLTAHLANRIYDTYNVAIPQLNAAPVLWRVVQECFCGTPMLYALTKRVANVLSLGLTIQGPPASSLSSAKGNGEKQNSAPPEISLIATAVIVLKLVYGLDGKERLPRNPDDAAWAFPTVNEFFAAVREADEAESRFSSHRFSPRKTLSVGDLDDAALDDYLDFCQKVLVDPKRDEHSVIGSYFPLASGTVDLTRRGPPDLKGPGLWSTRGHGGKSALEPGEKYAIYDAKDVLGNLPGDLDMMMERSARWSGIGSDEIGVVVERYERRLLRWWHETGRKINFAC